MTFVRALLPFATPAAILLALCSAGCSLNHENTSESPPPAHLSTAPLSYADVVERVVPAVVTVRSARRVRMPTQFPFSDDDFLRRFFGEGPFGSRPRTQVERALGSGVIVKSDGYILTNQHVIDGAQEIKVDLTNHRTYSAKLIGADAPSDLAVLKIDAGNLPVLQLGDSDKVRVGDICLAVGYPLGIGQTVTNGIVSAKGRRTGLSNGSFEDFLQTDAPINQGNSGGALVNTTGVLIGINSQILSTTGGNIGLGFAIPSNMAKSVMDQLVRRGKVQRGHLGVTVQAMTSDLAESFGLKDVSGVVVNSVEGGGPADRAGIKAGDVIAELNGKKIEDPNSFRNELAGTAPGTSVDLTIWRNGQQVHVHPTLTDVSTSAQSEGQNRGAPGSGGQLGIAVEPLTPGAASQLGLKPGTQGALVTDVNPLGAGADAGLRSGDVIVQVNHQPVRSASDIESALGNAHGRPSLLLISRGGQTFFITIGAH